MLVVVGCWFWVVVCWLLGGWVLIVDYLLLVDGGWLLAVGFWMVVVVYQLLVSLS